MILTTPGLEEAIAMRWPLTFLAYIDHPDGEVRLWAGVGDLHHDSHIWKGVGQLGRVPEIAEQRQLAVRTIGLMLRGVPPDAAATLNDDVRNRALKIWIAGMKPHGRAVNGEPWQVIDGLSDYQELEVGQDGAATIRLVASEPVFSIERAQNLAWTPEWLNETFGASSAAPTIGDRITGLDLISTLANRTESWTRT